MNVKVYRVETGDTMIGPYMTEDHCNMFHDIEERDGCIGCERRTFAYEMDWHNVNNGHPGPYDDLSAEDYEVLSGDHKFGFANQDDCLAWFEAEWDDLAALGYVVRVYEVPRDAVLFGEHQVAFDYEAASCRDTWRM